VTGSFMRDKTSCANSSHQTSMASRATTAIWLTVKVTTAPKGAPIGLADTWSTIHPLARVRKPLVALLQSSGLNRLLSVRNAQRILLVDVESWNRESLKRSTRVVNDSHSKQATMSTPT